MLYFDININLSIKPMVFITSRFTLRVCFKQTNLTFFEATGKLHQRFVLLNSHGYRRKVIYQDISNFLQTSKHKTALNCLSQRLVNIRSIITTSRIERCCETTNFGQPHVIPCSNNSASAKLATWWFDWLVNEQKRKPPIGQCLVHERNSMRLAR